MTAGLTPLLAKDATHHNPGCVINISSIASISPVSVGSRLASPGSGLWSCQYSFFLLFSQRLNSPKTTLARQRVNDPYRYCFALLTDTLFLSQPPHDATCRDTWTSVHYVRVQLTLWMFLTSIEQCERHLPWVRYTFLKGRMFRIDRRSQRIPLEDDCIRPEECGWRGKNG